MVRVGNNRPDLGVNPICNRFTGVIEEGRPLFLPCNPPMPGAFVSIHFEGNVNISYIVVWAKSSDFSRRQAPATSANLLDVKKNPMSSVNNL